VTLTLRKKLFIAFLLSVLGPAIAMACLALVYASDMTTERTARFVDESVRAFAERDGEIQLQTLRFAQRVGEEAYVTSCRDTACYQALFEKLRVWTPGAAGAEEMVVRAGADIFFSTVAPSERLPGLEVSEVGAKGTADSNPALDESRDRLIPSDIEAQTYWIPEPGKRLWLRVPLGGAELFVTIATQSLLGTTSFLSDHVTAFVGSGVTPQLTGSFEDLAHPDLHDKLPPRGEFGIVVGRSGTRYAVVTAGSGENGAFQALQSSADLFAAVPEATLLRPITRLVTATSISVIVFLFIGLVVAATLSQNMLRTLEQVRASLLAIGRGESVQMEHLSRDELGGALVESVNRLAQQLAERARVEELEHWRRVIRVLSHEINNTLAPLRSVASTMREAVGQPDGLTGDLSRSVALMSDRIDALDRFVRRFGELARLPAPAFERTQLAVVVEQATRMFTEEARERGVALTLELSGVQANVDAGQLERVVINLVKNAIEASPAGGTVTVRLRRAATAAQLEVEDEGLGISPAAKANLFVPSFSTKPGGSGIGLALAQQIVVGHGGWMTIADSPRGGALFQVMIPLEGHR
jgi:signal transduction histidine kinase